LSDNNNCYSRNGRNGVNSGVRGYLLKKLDAKKFLPGFLDALEEDPSARKDVHLGPEKLEDERSSVWILQCPANVNLGELVSGKKINLEGTTQLESEAGGGGKLYEAVGLPKSEDSGMGENLVALLPDESGELKLVAAPVKGYIMVRESLEELPMPKLLPNPKPHHTLPEGIKERHPIYGADFNKVFEEIAASQKKSKKKKKKRREEPEEVETTIVTETPRKSKKSKLNGTATPEVIKVEPITPRKKKRDERINGIITNGLTNGNHSEDSPSASKNKKSLKKEVFEEPAPELIKRKSKKSKSKLET
jgi:hypothetical protein